MALSSVIFVWPWKAKDQPMRGADRVGVQVEAGSATSWGRRPDRAWLVRLQRGRRSVIVAWGLERGTAERLATKIVDLLGGPVASCSRPRRRAGQP